VKRPIAWTRSRPADDAALVSTAGVLLLGGATCTIATALWKPVPFAVDPALTPFFGPHEVSAHLSLIKPFFDARAQSLAHLVMTAALGLLVLLAGGRSLPKGRRRIGPIVGASVAAAAAGAFLYAPGPKPVAFALSLPALVVLLAASRWTRSRIPNGLMGVVVLAAVAAATLPGFLGPPDFSRVRWPELAFAQSHWSVVMAAGDLLLSGRRLLVDVRPDYGVLLPLLVAGVERIAGPFSFGGEVHLLQALQLLYLGLATLLYWRHARGRWLLVAVALLAVVPWHHFAHRSLLFPNQSPWRSIGVPLSLAALLFLRKDEPRADALRLGVAAGTALLLNLESGTAMSVAIATFLYFRHGVAAGPSRGRRATALVPPFLAGVLAAVAGALVLGRVVTGEWVPLDRLPSLFLNAVFLSSGGFSGFPLVIDPWPLLIFGHAVYVLARAALDPVSAAGATASFRAAVAAALVVWFAYYANRPHPWNLSSYYVLYGFLLIDLVRDTASGFARRRASVRLGLAFAVLGGVVLPNVLAIAKKGGDQVQAALGPVLRREAPPGARLVSGVFVEPLGGGAVLQKAATIAARRAEAPVYFTSDSWLVPKVAGVFPALPVVDACWESTTRTAYRRIVDTVHASPASRVFFDPPGTPAYYSDCALFYERLRVDLSDRFTRGPDAGGWEVWIPRGNETGEATVSSAGQKP
jgi:hypothetical protein